MEIKNNYKNLIQDKRILITGGTGSFGSAIVEKLIELGTKKIYIFSRDEKKQFDMRNEHEKNKKLEFIIGDTRDKESLDSFMGNVDLVFHAAALKQVPSCEFFPIEAVRTNILGSSNVIRSAIENKVERVVVLGTDKAVYPINVMGQSKALMEKIMAANSRRSDNSTILCGIRYGNVMNSRGSVIPVFREQIRQNKPVTITYGEMTRFMLKMEEAIDLALYALASGENGNIFIKKAPATTIRTLAEALIKIYGNEDNEIVEIGIRHGEKIHEVLVSQEELFRAEDMGEYFKISPETGGLNYEKYYQEGNKVRISNNQGYTSENTKRLNLDETIELLKNLEDLKNY
jgi:UDP-glucose 4-epimerase